MSLRLALPTPAATDALGELLAKALPAGVVVYLRGDLGAGKSSLARALLRARGVDGPIKSPTYSLVERYRTDSGDALHLDLYRIREAAELEFLGLDDLGPGPVLWLVEWPERGGAGLPPADLEIELAVDGAGRLAVLRPGGASVPAWWTTLSKMAALRAFA